MKVFAMTTPPKNEHPLYQQAQQPGTPPPTAQRRQRPPTPPEDRPYLTYALIAINVVIFLFGYLLPDMQRQLYIEGALFAPLVVEENQLYRLVTSMFLHGDPAHILFNMYALFIVGNMIEPLFGRLRFGLIYFLGGLAGSVLSLTLGAYDSASVGASGAIFAVFAAEAVHLYQHRELYVNATGNLRYLLILMGVQIFLGFYPGSRIDNWGHIGGLLGGAILAWRIAPRLQRPTSQPKSRHDLAKTDSNPLMRHLPDLVIYCGILIGVLVFALNTLGS